MSRSSVSDPQSIVTASPPPTGSSLTGRVVRGTVWNVIGAMVNHGAALGSSIIVARLLSPTDYAIGGLAISVMGLFNVLTAQGFALALIRRKNLAMSTCHSVFWPMVLGGLGLGALAVASAPWLARFYGQPALVPVIWVLALGLVASMVGGVPNALLRRALRFREINLVNIVGTTLSAALGIAIAWLGQGYWALVAPIAGMAIALAAGTLWLSGYRPARVFRWDEFKSVLTFGLLLLGSALLRYAADNGDYLILSKSWSKVDFGLYYFAFERARQPFQLVATQLQSVIFPAFSMVQDDIARFRRAFLRGTGAICLIAFPLHVLLVGLADPLVPWLFGEHWRPAVSIFQVFALFGFVRAYASMVSGGLLAINLPRGDVIFNIFRIVVILPTLIFLGSIRATIFTTSVVLLLIWSIQAPFYISYLGRRIGVGFRDLWVVSSRLVAAAIVMGMTLFLCRAAMLANGWSAWSVVLVSSLISLAVFATLTWRQIKLQLGLVLQGLGPSKIRGGRAETGQVVH